ncbi:MAG: hypothetical protein RLZZ546_1873 [Bacteroidota bacterium]|jgi:hypothetical protein
MTKKISYIILIFAMSLLSTLSFATITVYHNGKLYSNIANIDILVGDTLVIKSDSAINFYSIVPIYKGYSNIGISSYFSDINYSIAIDHSNLKEKELKINTSMPGTYLYLLSDFQNKEFSYHKPLYTFNKNILQFSIREDNTYIGYLTELLNLPFLLGPKKIHNYGHQTDLRIGVDCAELAIYGRRRMGYKIPYCGPRNILKYLNQVNEIKEGTIIHFRFQVSIVYKDLGIKGKLDNKDYLIHAHEDKVKIEKFKACNLNGYPFKIFEWK